MKKKMHASAAHEPVPMLNAGFNCCRDVVARGFYCGKPVERGSFCAEHAAIYYVKPYKEQP